jgi:hypothetical protein
MKTFEKYEHIELAICVPSTGVWKAKTARALAAMCLKLGMWRPKGLKSLRVHVITLELSMLVTARHRMTKEALKTGCTHILFIDSDMVFPDDTAQRLLAWEKPFVAANCTTRSFPVRPIAHDLKGHVISSKGKHGLQKVRQVGLAVALLETEMLKQMQPPLYMMDWIPDLQDYCGEDIYFSQLMAEHGIDTYVDHDLSQEIKHVGEYAFGYDDLNNSDLKETG